MGHSIAEGDFSVAKKTKNAKLNKGENPKSSGSAPAVPEGTFAVIDKSKLVNEVSMGLKKDERGRLLEGSESGKVFISKELVERYKNHLRGLFISIKEVTIDPSTNRKRPNLDGTFLASPAFQTERHLLNTIVNEEGELDEKKLEEYLKDPNHIQLIDQMMANHQRMRLFALNVAMIADPKGNRDAHSRVDIKQNVDRGVLNKFFEDELWPWLKSSGLTSGRNKGLVHTRLMKILGARTISATAGWGLSTAGFVSAISLGTLTIPAFAVAAVSTLLIELTVNSAFKEGLKIDKKQCLEGLAMLQDTTGAFAENRKSEVDFLKTVLGVDLSDYTADLANNKLIVNSSPPKTMNREKILSDSLDLMYTRFQYYKELGVDVTDVDAMLEQGLLDHKNGPFSLLDKKGHLIEQTRTKATDRIVQIYLDLNGTFGPLPGDEALKRKEIKNRLELMTEARLKYMRELMLRDCTTYDAKERQAQEAVQIAAIDSKLAARKEGGPKVTKKQEELDKLKKNLDGDKKLLTSDSEKLKDVDSVDQPFEEKQKEIDDLLIGLGINKAGIANVTQPTSLPSGTPEEVENSAVEILRRMTKEKFTDVYPPDGLSIGGIKIGKDSISQQIYDLKNAQKGDLDTEDAPVLAAEGVLETAKTDLSKAKSEKADADADVAVAQAELDRHNQIILALTQQRRAAGDPSAMDQMVAYENEPERKQLLADLNSSIKTLRQTIRTTFRTEITRAEVAVTDKDNLVKLAKAKADSGKDLINQKYTLQEKVLNERSVTLSGAQMKLEELITLRNAAKKEVESKKLKDPDLKEAVERQKSFKESYDTLTAYVDAGGRKIITDPILRVSTVEEILKKINEANAIMKAPPPPLVQVNPEAWPEGQNELPQRRLQVLRAIVESKAIEVRASKVPRTPVTNEDRREVIVTYTKNIDRKQILIDADRAAVFKSFEKEVGELQVVQELLARQSKVFESTAITQNFVMNKGASPDFLKEMSFDPNAEASEVEVRSATNPIDYSILPQGYFEFVDLVTGYKSDKDRNASFKKWREVLTPDVMKDYIWKYLLGKVTPSPNILTTIGLANTAMKDAHIAQDSVRRFMYEVGKEKLMKTNRSIS